MSGWAYSVPACALLQQPRYKNNVSVSFQCRAHTACLFVSILAAGIGYCTAEALWLPQNYVGNAPRLPSPRGTGYKGALPIAGGGGRRPNNINFCGGGVMLLIGRLVCQGKGRHVGSGSSSGLCSGSSAAVLDDYELAERLLSSGEVHGGRHGRAKRQKTARAAPSEPPS